jgi:hypothetical protein
MSEKEKTKNIIRDLKDFKDQLHSFFNENEESLLSGDWGNIERIEKLDNLLLVIIEKAEKLEKQLNRKGGEAVSENRFSEFNESERSEITSALRIQFDRLNSKVFTEEWKQFIEIRKGIIKKLIKELQQTFER